MWPAEMAFLVEKRLNLDKEAQNGDVLNRISGLWDR